MSTQLSSSKVRDKSAQSFRDAPMDNVFFAALILAVSCVAATLLAVEIAQLGQGTLSVANVATEAAKPRPQVEESPLKLSAESHFGLPSL